MSERRTLAAILAADVVGFSRSTGADEDRTLARLMGDCVNIAARLEGSPARSG